MDFEQAPPERPKPPQRVIETDARNDTEVLGPDDFVAQALLWRERGYPPLILGGDDGKRLLVAGITGYSPHDATEAQIRSWPTQFRKVGEVTLGVRCPHGVIGLDVDAYDGKRGLTTLAEHVKRLGKLPPTYITTARDDESGIRWYSVPPDWRGHDLKADDGSKGHVELIQRHHRYAVVPPSDHHTGAPYRLYGPDGDEIRPGTLPRRDKLPRLPVRWLVPLAVTTRAASRRWSQPGAVTAWLDEWTGDDYSHGLGQVIRRFHRLVNDGGKDRHHAMIDVLTLALKESRAGGYPARRAEAELRGVWLAAIAVDNGHDETEFDAMFPWAIGQAESDDHDERWLIMRRDYGTDHRDERGMFDGFESRVRTESDNMPTAQTSTNTSGQASKSDSSGKAEAGQDEERSSWAPVDMAAALDDDNDLTPTILTRSDGARLFYAGKVHSVHGESESGKSWLALVAAAECLLAGRPVLFVDFEDDAKSIGKRLLLLEVPKAVVEDPELFVYVRPEIEPKTGAELKAFDGLLSRRFTLAVVDGVTESMDLFGLSGSDNDDVAKWQRKLPKAIARSTGAAVVCVDHVTKDPGSRGRFALGGQHKMAGLDGAAFIVEPDTPFARSLAGEASVRVGKDRPGAIRGLGGRWRKSDRTQLVGTFRLDSTDPARTAWALEAPADITHAGQIDSSGTGGLPARPKWCMERVSRYWEATTELEKRSTRKTVDALYNQHKASGAKIGRDTWRRAVDVLVTEGYATWKAGPRKSHLHTSVRPYREADDATPDSMAGAHGGGDSG